jgi:hypothetical protein
MDSSPRGGNVVSQPEPDEPPRWFTTDAERRAFGRAAILVSLACCALPLLVVLAVFRDWDRIQVAQSNTPIWVTPLVFACYAAPAVAFLLVGRSLLSGRARLASIGGALLVGALVTLVTLFAAFD